LFIVFLTIGKEIIMRKRIIATLLASCMVFAMAACGNEEQKETMSSSESKTEVESSKTSEEVPEEKLYYNTTDYFPICEENIKITVAGQNSSTPDWNDTEFVKVVSEQMGIDMECTQYEGDAWGTQLTLMLASEELPDLFAGMNQEIAVVNGYGEDGYLLPLNEYLDIMPAFKAYLDANPDYKAIITAPDGNIYGLTYDNASPQPSITRTFINKVWLENVGMSKPTDADELYEVLKAFKEKDANGNGDPNDEIPLTGNFTSMTNFMHMFGMFTDNTACSPVVDKNGNVVLGQATDNYKAMVKYIRKLYEEGLYDIDGLVQTDAEMNVKFAEDRAGMVTCGSAPYVLAGKDAAYDRNWDALMGLTSEVNDVKAKVIFSGASTGVRIAVNAETEYPEAICRFIDFLYTYEGQVATARGFLGVSAVEDPIEGTDYVIANVRSDYDKDYPGQFASSEEYRYKKALPNNAFRVVGAYEGTIYECIMNVNEEEFLALPEFVQSYYWYLTVDMAGRECEKVDAYPILVYTDEEAKERATLLTDIRLYVTQSFGQFVTGELDIDAEWDNYVKTLQSMGMDKLCKIEQTAYDRAYK